MITDFFMRNEGFIHKMFRFGAIYWVRISKLIFFGLTAVDGIIALHVSTEIDLISLSRPQKIAILGTFKHPLVSSRKDV